MSGALIMAGVAMLCAIGAAILFLRTAPNEASIYRNRIAATMLMAGAITLAIFAWALHRLDAAV